VSASATQDCKNSPVAIVWFHWPAKLCAPSLRGGAGDITSERLHKCDSFSDRLSTCNSQTDQ